jgi:ribonuclease HII
MPKQNTVLASRHTDDSLVEAGLDEAGRGCFWGPIMAGCLVWPNPSEWSEAQRAIAPDIRDSKKIAPKKRERIFEQIQELATGWGVGSVSAQEIDEHGITWANQEAFRRALSAMRENSSIEPERIIIDGAISLPGFAGEQHTVVEGDGKFIHVAGASILAKVSHDRMVLEYCAENPECEERYHLTSGHGYGTKQHRDGLRAHGAHELHRNTFIYNWVEGGVAPVKPANKKFAFASGGGTGGTNTNEVCLIRLPGSK